MKKLRCLYLWTSIALMIGVNAPTAKVFAETSENEAAETVSYEAEPTDDLNQTETELVENTNNETERETEQSQEDTKEVVVDEGDEAVVDYLDEGMRINLVLKSYNPGFSTPIVGEFFELRKLSKNAISLAGLSITYETSSGSEYLVYEFIEGDEMVGESLLLRLASSDEVKAVEDFSQVADATYTRNMSQSGGRIKLVFKEDVFDSLCWGLKETGCYKAFKTGKNVVPTTLVREITEDEIGDFEFLTDYTPEYNPEEPGLIHVEEEPKEIVEPKCSGLEFSEVYTYYENASSEQFIELFNRGEEELTLDGCYLKYKNANYALSGSVLAHDFIVFYPGENWNLSLTKNPISSNDLDIIDVNSERVDRLTYYSGQRKGVSFAMVGLRDDGSKNWIQTFHMTPGEDNIYQQFKTCPVGKVINLATGNCVNDSPVELTLAACPDGKYRNPLTGRCKSYASLASTELKPCAEGYERNPATNRCKKIVNNSGATYPVEITNYEEKTEFTSIYTLASVIALGLFYIAFQYKDEIIAIFNRKRAL